MINWARTSSTSQFFFLSLSVLCLYWLCWPLHPEYSSIFRVSIMNVLQLFIEHLLVHLMVIPWDVKKELLIVVNKRGNPCCRLLRALTMTITVKSMPICMKVKYQLSCANLMKNTSLIWTVENLIARNMNPPRRTNDKA